MSSSRLAARNSIKVSGRLYSIRSRSFELQAYISPHPRFDSGEHVIKLHDHLRIGHALHHPGHARALLALPDAAAMERMAQKIVSEGMSVRATEEAVTLYQSPSTGPKSNIPRPGARHERLDYLASSLADRLDTNVKISLGARKGRVSIEFASVEDLNRIMDVLAPGPSS